LAKYRNQKQLLAYLSDAIMTEMKKPVDEIDFEFVDSCENLLNTLMKESTVISDETQKKIDEIIGKKLITHNKPSFKPKRKSFVKVAAFIAFFLLCSSVAVYATGPVIKDYIVKVLNSDLNQTITKDGITYKYKGKTVKYNSIEDLVSTEDLNIFYPTTFAYDASILKVLRDESGNSTVFIFDNNSLNFEISHNITINLNQYIGAELYEYDNQTFYIFDSIDESIAYTLINDDLYTLSCKSKDQLIIMINSFNFETIE